jgi:hypothetical protein
MTDIIPIPHSPDPATTVMPPITPSVIVAEDTLPPELDFIPVPRLAKRWNGITAQKQRHFMAQLAGSGSVAMAANAIGVSTSALYQLRKGEGAESFAAAWEKAVEMGARRVLDLLMDHAIHGTPETLLKGGEVILERRKYNTRAMMWIVQQRFPETYGGNLNVLNKAPNSMPHGIRKLKEQWRKEWEDEHHGSASEEATNTAITEQLKVLHQRTWHKKYVPWMDDTEKRTACELLYGEQDWEEIRRLARKDELDGRLEPEEEARLRSGG